MFSSLHTGALGFSLPFAEMLDLARTTGYRGLELPLDDLVPLAQGSSSEAIKDRFAAAGVCPGGWDLPVDIRAAEAVYHEQLMLLPRYARLASALGSPWCSTWIMPRSNDLDYATHMEWHITRLRPIAQILAEHGCRLALEFIGPKTLRTGYKFTFVSTIDGALELAQRIGTGNVGLLLDSFHWYTSHATIDDLLQLTCDQVVHVHINDAVAGRGPDEQIDSERLLPGVSGVIDVAGFLQAVDRIGYVGPVCVEPFNADLSAQPPNERARLAYGSLERVWAQAGLSPQRVPVVTKSD